MKEHLVIRTVSKALVPFIQLFALYVVAHGGVSPGGGFQGGVIFASSIIIYVLAFGMPEGRKRISEKMSDTLNSTGALLFAAIGVLCLFAGGAFLEYNALASWSDNPEQVKHIASHFGIYSIEIGVGITVAAVMITIFFETARQDDD